MITELYHLAEAIQQGGEGVLLEPKQLSLQRLVSLQKQRHRISLEGLIKGPSGSRLFVWHGRVLAPLPLPCPQNRVNLTRRVFLGCLLRFHVEHNESSELPEMNISKNSTASWQLTV